jgi:hypothetical protein
MKLLKNIQNLKISKFLIKKLRFSDFFKNIDYLFFHYIFGTSISFI